MDYRKIYNKIIDNRKSNPLKKGNGFYLEEHHILPRSLGGTDESNNLVNLTAKEHYVCHLLLTKMFPDGSLEKFKMINAFLIMSGTGKVNLDRIYRSRTYERLQAERAKLISIMYQGEGNSQYGKIWISNIEEEKNIKISEDDFSFWETLGYVKGRFNFEKRKRICVCCGKQFLSLNEAYKKTKTCSIICKKENSRKNHNLLESITKDKILELLDSGMSISKAIEVLGYPSSGQYYKHVKSILGDSYKNYCKRKPAVA